MKIPVMNHRLNFDKAFAGARLLNVPEFIWRSNRYHTRRYTDEEEIRARRVKQEKLLKPIRWVDA